MYFPKHPKNSSPYHKLWSRRGGFSLVEVMVAVGLSAGVIYALTTLIQYSFEDVAHYKDKESSTDVHRHFSKQWSSILKTSGLSPHFLKVSVNINKNCTDFGEDEGGPCVFAFKKIQSSCIAPIPGRKLNELRNRARNLKPKIERRYINIFKDEWLHTIARPLNGVTGKNVPKCTHQKESGKKAPCVLTHHQATIPPALHSSERTRYFVGWKLAEKKSFPLLLHESRLKGGPVTFNFKTVIENYTDLNLKKNKDDDYIIQSSRKLEEDDHYNDYNKLKEQFILFHDSSDPRIYTLKIIEYIEPCGDENNCKNSAEENNVHFFKKDKDQDFSNKLRPILKSPYTHYVKFFQKKEKYDQFFDHIRSKYIRRINENENITWSNKDRKNTIINVFPLHLFSLNLKVFSGKSNEGRIIFKATSKSEGAKNIYKTIYTLRNSQSYHSKSSIVGLPVQFVTIDLKRHASSKSDDTKRYKLVKTIHTPGSSTGEKHTTVLIPSLVVEKEGRGRKAPRKEHILIGRQFGSQNFSVFFTDLQPKPGCSNQ